MRAARSPGFIIDSLFTEHCNGTLTARLAMLAEAESRQREEIQKLRSELREETTKVHTAEVPTNRPSIGSMHTERLRLQTRLELMKKDFASEVAFLKGQLEDTNRAEGMRLAEVPFLQLMRMRMIAS